MADPVIKVVPLVTDASRVKVTVNGWSAKASNGRKIRFFDWDNYRGMWGIVTQSKSNPEDFRVLKTASRHEESADTALLMYGNRAYIPTRRAFKFKFEIDCPICHGSGKVS